MSFGGVVDESSDKLGPESLAAQPLSGPEDGIAHESTIGGMPVRQLAVPELDKDDAGTLERTDPGDRAVAGRIFGFQNDRDLW